MSIIGDLEKFGLSEKEARVYLAGLELGTSSASDISKKSKVNRSNVYEILRRLIEKEVFSETFRKTKKYFIPTHPKELEKAYLETLGTVTLSLENISNITEGKPKIYFYDDIDNIRSAYERIIESENKHTLGFAFDDVSEKLGEEWLETYIQKRKDRRLHTKTIAAGFMGSKKWTSRDAQDERRTKIISQEHGDLDTNVEIFGEKVFITSLKGETMGLIIESKKIADTMRVIFNTLWDKL